MSPGIHAIQRFRFPCAGAPRPLPAPGRPLLSRCTGRLPPLVSVLDKISDKKFQSTSPPEAPEPSRPTSTKGLQLRKPRHHHHHHHAQVVGPNYARNEFFRDAYRETSPRIGDQIAKQLSSPYVPAVRGYPSKWAARESKRRAQSMARLQVAYDTVWSRFGTRVERFHETFNLLKAMTMRRDGKAKMVAVKIVLPQDWDIDVGSQGVEFLDSATGLVARLRMSADHQDPSAIILRGKSTVLAKAADALVRACPAVEVFQLGEVAAFGYEVKQLWPVIADAPDGGASVPEDGGETIWVHKEQRQPYWIDRPYEETARPEEWTTESFEAYVSALVFGRLRPHLAVPLYDALVDSDGVRIDLITKAFTDPAARTCITPGALKLAMSFMVHRGGHRAAADQLLKLAEEWGMPMDTDLLNIMLEGYAAKHDVAFFHKFLLKMQARFFHPDIRTWILFLQLVQKDVERRQVIVAMYDLGFFGDPATRRGIARVMASHDAYVAFKAGRKLSLFLAEQTARYGSDWFTTGSLDCLLHEFFRFHDARHPRFNDFKTLIEEHQSEDGEKIAIGTFNLVLQHCLPSSNWSAALWALTKLSECACEPDAQTYDHLVSLAIRSNSPHALGVVFFYATLYRMLRVPARSRLLDVLTKRPNVSAFWQEHSPKVFSQRMGAHLKFVEKAYEHNAVAAVEHVILKECDGFLPVKSLAYSLRVALGTMDSPLHAQLKQDPGGEEALRSGYMAIKLKGEGPDGEPVKKTVHLDGCFVPEEMLRRRGASKQASQTEFRDEI